MLTPCDPQCQEFYTRIKLAIKLLGVQWLEKRDQIIIPLQSPKKQNYEIYVTCNSKSQALEFTLVLSSENVDRKERLIRLLQNNVELNGLFSWTLIPVGNDNNLKPACLCKLPFIIAHIRTIQETIFNMFLIASSRIAVEN